MFNPQKGMPIAVRVRNISDKPQRVCLFDVNQLFDHSLRNPDLRITSQYPTNLSYIEICAGIMMVRCTIERIYCYADSEGRKGNASFLQNSVVFDLCSKDYFGTQVTVPIRMLKDPNQFQKDVCEIKQPFRIDGLTTVSFNIPGDAEVNILFFTAVEKKQEPVSSMIVDSQSDHVAAPVVFGKLKEVSEAVPFSGMVSTHIVQEPLPKTGKKVSNNVHGKKRTSVKKTRKVGRVKVRKKKAPLREKKTVA